MRSAGLGLPGPKMSRIFVKPRSKFFDAMRHQFTLNSIQKLKSSASGGFAPRLPGSAPLIISKPATVRVKGEVFVNKRAKGGDC